MRKLLALVGSLALACGEGAPTATETPGPAASVVIDQPPGDSVKPLRVFPDSLGASVSDNAGRPIEGVLVNAETEPEGCVDLDSPSLQTNGQGRVFFELTAGEDAVTKIGPCTVRTIRSREGRAEIGDSLEVTILPHELAVVGMTVRVGGMDSVTYPVSNGPRDRFGNPVPWRFAVDSFAHVAGTDPWTEDAKTLVGDSVGMALVDVLHADTLLCKVSLSVRTDGSLRVREGSC